MRSPRIHQHAFIPALVIGFFFLAASPGSVFAYTLDLGTAGNYVAATLDGTNKMTLSGNHLQITGDVFVGDTSGSPDFKFSGGGDIIGTVYTAPGATTSITGGSAVTGGTAGLSAAEANQVAADLLAALTTIHSLTATQTFGTISGDTLISANISGLNVIDATALNLRSGSTLTLSGNSDDWFIFRVSGGLTTSGNSNITANVGAGHILFDVAGNISTSGGLLMGTYISESGTITVSGGDISGAFLEAGTGKQMKFESNPEINFVKLESNVPLPNSLSLMSLGLLMMLVRSRRGNRLAWIWARRGHQS